MYEMQNGNEKKWKVYWLMATDRQIPCLYYVCAGLCKKGRKADHTHYCQHCNKYKPRARVRYKNQKKEYLERIRKEERY